jgi:hypothetical protein
MEAHLSTPIINFMATTHRCHPTHLTLRIRTHLLPPKYLLRHTTPPPPARGRLTLPPHILLKLLIPVYMALKAPQTRARTDLPPKDIRLNPPRQHSPALMAHKPPRRNRKDIIEFFQGSLFRLRKPQEYHDERDEIKAGVEGEGAGGRHGGEHAGECDGEDGGPEETCCDGPGHAYFAVGEGEDFGGVGEWDGAFAGGVECCELWV